MLRKALLLSFLVAQGAAGEESSLRLSINLPTYQLEVWDGEERIRNYTVTIGAPDFPTPTGGFQLTRIEWNPSWTPPPSPWARGLAKASPGPRNPMGRAKLQFDEYLYVHGSHKEDQLGGAHSHGCIRLSNADVLDLARLLATRTGMLTSEQIDALEANSRRTRSVRLPEPIPIRIRYGLNEEVDGDIVELDDPYEWRSTQQSEAPAPAAAAAGASLASAPPDRGMGSSPTTAEAR